MKKFLMLILLVLCAGVCLVACGDDDDDDSSSSKKKKKADADVTETVTEEVTPTPTPRDCKGIEVFLLDWWSNPETWRTPNNQYQTVFFDMLADAEETYNFKFNRKNAEYGWGNNYIEATTLSITNNKPDGQIVTMDNRWIASLLSNGQFTDVSKVSTVDWSDEKWNARVKEVMTINGGLYGFAAGTEARTGVFFNKGIFKQFNVDPELPYDLQKEGKWSWEEFSKLCKQLTKDTNNDDVTDVYAVCGQDYIVAYGAMQSNGVFVIEKESNGLLKVNASDSKVIDALNFVTSLRTDGYMFPRPETVDGSNWDFFKKAFYDGKSAMYIEEEWADTQEIRVNAPELDYGFVCFPYGPAEGKLVSIIRENILFVPSCPATADVVEDILFAYNIYTSTPEEYKGDDAIWQSSYDWKFNDERAVNETIRLMVKDLPQLMYAATLLPQFGDESWPAELQAGSTVAEVLESWTPKWETEVGDFNAKFK